MTNEARLNGHVRLNWRWSIAVAIAVVSVVGVGYYATRWPTVEIDDVTRATTVVIHARPWQSNIHAISIRVRGELDGKGGLGFAKVGPELFLTGKFSTGLTGRDWYNTTCEMNYMPTNVQSGRIVISYRFHD